MAAGLIGALLFTVATADAGATTSTTLPGPAPNQAQINASQSQVSQIEATLATEEQQTSILDDKYNTAVQNLQNAQSTLASLATSLLNAKSAVQVDKRNVSTDAVAAYVYGTPQTGFTSYFSTSATLNQARNQYTDQIVGNLTKDEAALESSEARLTNEEVQQQNVAAQAQAEAAQAKSLAQANEQEAATTKQTLGQVQGQLAQEVAASRDSRGPAGGSGRGAGGQPTPAATGHGGGAGGGDRRRHSRWIGQRCGGDRRREPGVR